MILRRPSRRGDRGFTIIEMIVATLLLAIGVAAALGCVATATHATGVASEYTQAALLAQQQFASLQSQTDKLSAGEQQGDFGDQNPGYTWDQNIETTDFTGLYRVTLTIEWPGAGGGRRSAQFVTYTQATNSQSGTTAGASPTATP